MEFLRTSLVLALVICEIDRVTTLKNDETNTSDLKRKSTLCTEEKCVMKCCPFGKYVTKPKTSRTTCNSISNTTKTFADLAQDVFPEIISTLNLTVKAGIFEANETFKAESFNIRFLTFVNVHLTDYSHIVLEVPNNYDRWLRIPNDKYCWDYFVSRVKNRVTPGIWVILPNQELSEIYADFLNPGGILSEDESSPAYTIILYALDIGLLLTCFFLLVVLVVYTILPELRSLGGQILMSYVASLFNTFLLLFIMHIRPYDVATCIILTSLIYYFFIASFCWLNVMSYDIWCTFRGHIQVATIHRRGNFKFLRYCLYAFGLPFAMTVALNILNTIDMSHLPWFVTPQIPEKGCFIQGGERFLYMYMPMLILILFNWAFYLMTAVNIWRLIRGTEVLDSAAVVSSHARRTQRHRFMVYVKLSAVMGLHWVLVVVRSRYPGYNFWLISDFYNILIGVTIFLIFVCKRKILAKLKQRFSRFKIACRPDQDQDKQLELGDATLQGGGNMAATTDRSKRGGNP